MGHGDVALPRGIAPRRTCLEGTAPSIGGSLETSVGNDPTRHAFAARAAHQCCSSFRAPAENRTRSSTMARWRAAGTPRVRKCASSGTIRVLLVGSQACSRVHLTREEMLLAAALTLPPWASETPPIPNRDLVERLRRRGRGAPPRAKWRCSVTLRVSLLARQARSLLHIPLAPSQRIERCSPDLETGCPPWAARHRAPRMGFDPISTRLEKPPSTPADSRGLG